jgi:hypothetical protein
MTLDPAIRTGFAVGDASEMPRVGAARLKKPSEPIEVAIANMGCFLRDQFVLDRPDLLVIEKALHPSVQPHAAPVISSLMLEGAIRAIAGTYGVRVEEVASSTFRKHFCGQANAGDRTATNLMVLRQAITMGYLPRTCTDWDRASACALFDYAAAKFANQAPKALVLFGEVHA